jgi:uncharacterized damage-inducible protein DinB
MSAKLSFINAYRQEHATTLRLLQAYPPDRSEFRPHERSRSARELAWVFVLEQDLCRTALTGGFDWATPSAPAPLPATLAEVITSFEAGRDQLTSLVHAKDDDLAGTVRFPIAARTLGDMPLVQFLWMMLCDQIHHRGQFSVYLRMVGGRVPSIYGPTADEAWL